MKVYFTVTIDTERDTDEKWDISQNGTFRSITDAIPNRLTPLFSTFRAKPTYLLTSDILQSQECLDVLTVTNDCELGTHLHGELIEPSWKTNITSNQDSREMQTSYPPEIEYEKLKNLTDLFIKYIGRQPTSFRSGRFAANENTIVSLEKLGYLVDTSLTPGIIWDYPEGKADFLHGMEQPYFPSTADFLVSGNSSILEVPISIFTSGIRRKIRTFETANKNSTINRVLNHFSPIQWIRPSFQTSWEMVKVIERLVKRYKNKPIVVLNMMFHSMEIIPKASPYANTETECQMILNRIGAVLKYARNNEYIFIRLSDLYELYR